MWQHNPVVHYINQIIFGQTLDFSSAFRLTSVWHISVIPDQLSASSSSKATNKPETHENWQWLKRQSNQRIRFNCYCLSCARIILCALTHQIQMTSNYTAVFCENRENVCHGEQMGNCSQHLDTIPARPWCFDWQSKYNGIENFRPLLKALRMAGYYTMICNCEALDLRTQVCWFPEWYCP